MFFKKLINEPTHKDTEKSRIIPKKQHYNNKIGALVFANNGHSSVQLIAYLAHSGAILPNYRQSVYWLPQ